MAYTCTVQEKRTFPVSIGSHIFYVEQYQLTGIRKFAEQTTIAGMSVFTNQAIRSRVLHMEGRFLRTDPPAELLLTLETALQEQTSFTAVYLYPLPNRYPKSFGKFINHFITRKSNTSFNGR